VCRFLLGFFGRRIFLGLVPLKMFLCEIPLAGLFLGSSAF
jgi:hypothetical protein